MTKYEKYKDVPHFDLIRENEPIVIPSIFMFKDNVELYPFLKACGEYNSTVFFENEKIIVPPEPDEETRLKILCYSTVMGCREIGDAYIRYLGNLAKMKWVQGEHEPILK
jgi:hypothetical protein